MFFQWDDGDCCHYLRGIIAEMGISQKKKKKTMMGMEGMERQEEKMGNEEEKLNMKARIMKEGG